MTFKEQIMKLQTYKMYEDEDTVYVERKDILKLLEQQPCEDMEVIQVSKGALKSRQGRFVIYDVEWLKKNFYTTEEKIYGQPKQPKKGKWEISTTETLDGQGLYECSVCGHLVFTPICNNYCPNCGADMRRGEEDV